LKRADAQLWIQEIFEIIKDEIHLYGLILNGKSFENELEETNEKERTQTAMPR
jgi:hypothetical protein